MFTRRSLVLKNRVSKSGLKEWSGAIETPQLPPDEKELRVLVVNSSHEMAKEITMELTLNLPGAAITYAPSIELAKWLLMRRPIDLVVSSPLLPDGSITRLQEVLGKIKHQPDVVVVGQAKSNNPHLFQKSGYKFAEVHKIGAATQTHKAIKELGADLRNDLNNPLQEIVAMVFVAKAASGSSTATSHALEAIDKAAKNMAKVVKGLEDRIKEAAVL